MVLSPESDNPDMAEQDCYLEAHTALYGNLLIK